MVAHLLGVDAAQRGVTLDRMFRNDYAWLVSRIRRRSSGPNDPEDVASETFVQCVNLPNLLDLRDPRAMLVTIAKRLLWRFSRKREIEDAYIASLTYSAQLYQPSDENRIEAISVLAAIDEALESFSERARTAFVRSHVDGWTHSEIAAELGVSVSMVRKYLARTLIACMAVMEAETAE